MLREVCDPLCCVRVPGFAHRIVELEGLPYGLSATASVKKVVEWYKHSVKDILTAPVPHNLQQEAEWSRMLENILLRHGPTLVRGGVVHPFRRTVHAMTHGCLLVCLSLVVCLCRVLAGHDG